MADNADQQFGDYGSNVLPQFTTTPKDTLLQLGQMSSYASGCDDTHCSKYDADSVKAAVGGADLIIVCLGTGRI